MTEGHAADKAMYISRRYEQATQFFKKKNGSYSFETISPLKF